MISCSFVLTFVLTMLLQMFVWRFLGHLFLAEDPECWSWCLGLSIAFMIVALQKEVWQCHSHLTKCGLPFLLLVSNAHFGLKLNRGQVSLLARLSAKSQRAEKRQKNSDHVSFRKDLFSSHLLCIRWRGAKMKFCSALLLYLGWWTQADGYLLYINMWQIK